MNQIIEHFVDEGYTVEDVVNWVIDWQREWLYEIPLVFCELPEEMLKPYMERRVLYRGMLAVKEEVISTEHWVSWSTDQIVAYDFAQDNHFSEDIKARVEENKFPSELIYKVETEGFNLNKFIKHIKKTYPEFENKTWMSSFEEEFFAPFDLEKVQLIYESYEDDETYKEKVNLNWTV